MKIRTSLTCRLLHIAAIIACSTAATYAQETPTLAVRCEVADFIKNLPANAPQSLRDFRGLFIEKNIVSDLYPLTTSIFFDAGSAELPDRDVLFTEPSQTAGFDEEKIPGGTFQKYYYLLNIIGARLRNHPDKAISVVGCNSRERTLGETRELSKQRAAAVRDYLVHIWGVDPARIKVLPPRDLPKRPSNPDDPYGAIENRRVEIISNDWEMARIINQREVRRFPQPEFMKFEMSNGVADSLVARREIVITRGGKPWHVMTDLGTTNRLSQEYYWGRNDNEDSIPDDQVPYTAQLIVYTADGQELLSNRVEVPVKIYTRRRGNCMDCRREILRYTLPLFSFDDAGLNAISQRALREYVYPSIASDAFVHVTGYTDNIGTDDYNLGLSERRADVVANDLQKVVKSSLTLDRKGVGEQMSLYSNDLPEGRFYNRTVHVIVENTRAGGWE